MNAVLLEVVPCRYTLKQVLLFSCNLLTEVINLVADLASPNAAAQHAISSVR